MSGWRKCDTCRKVRPVEEFDGDATTCRSCLTKPAPRTRASAATVTRRATTPRPPQPTGRTPLLGSVGSGDLEVRERRARRAAQEALAEMHSTEYALLLRDARAKEGLRPLSTPPVESPSEGPSEQPQ